MEKLAGWKTYSVVIGGILFNVLNSLGYLPEGMSKESVTEFVNTILMFAGVGFLRAGVKKTE